MNIQSQTDFLVQFCKLASQSSFWWDVLQRQLLPLIFIDIKRKSPNLPTRVGPRAKLEVALLVVEGKPRDVDLARRLEKFMHHQTVQLSREEHT